MRVGFVLRSAEASSLGLCNSSSDNYRDTPRRPCWAFSVVRNFRIPEKVQLSGHPNETLKKPSTPWCSRAVPQPSTDPALHRLAAEFGWDPACSMQYGRRLTIPHPKIPACVQLSGHLNCHKARMPGRTYFQLSGHLFSSVLRREAKKLIRFFSSAICSTYYFALS